MAPVSWSNLPSELIDKISVQLRSDTDQIRLRSVCTAWRTALPRRRPPTFPVIPNKGVYPYYPNHFSLIRRTFVILSPPLNSISNPNSNPTPWLLNIEENPSGNFHLLQPISRYPVKRLPTSVPNVINFSNIRISELGHEFILQFLNDNGLPYKGRKFYCRKVAYFPRGIVCDDYVVLAIHFSEKLLVMFRSVDQQWNIINDMDSRYYHDVVCFNGEFYAVDSTGRTVVVSPDSGDVVAVVAQPLLSNGNMKRLVQMGKELILVDVYDRTPLSESKDEDEDEEEDGQGDVDFDKYMWHDSKWFRVFKLDRDRGKWVETNNLGNWVLFVGDNCAFSASALDLKCKGNYICRTNIVFDYDLGLDYYEVHVQLFDLKASKVKYRDHSSYSKLFWPVPSWITSTT